MKKLIEVSLKSIIFFIGWAIFVSVIPIPDIDNTALWMFFCRTNTVFGDCYYDRHFLVCRS